MKLHNSGATSTHKIWGTSIGGTTFSNMIFLMDLDLLFQNMTLIFAISCGELRYFTFCDICLILSDEMIQILSLMSNIVKKINVICIVIKVSQLCLIY